MKVLRFVAVQPQEQVIMNTLTTVQQVSLNEQPGNYSLFRTKVCKRRIK
jgi:hypothetical protein